jgi:phosphatidylglycerol:prolipoprotein diacylglycerol transferase
MMEHWIINPFEYINVYPTFYLLAIYVGSAIVIYEIYRRRLPLLPMLVIMVWGLVFGIIGSKLLTLTPQEFWAGIKSGRVLFIHEKVYIGWLIGGMIGIKIFRRIMGFKFDLFDLFAFALPAGFALMRIGCLLGGCCFGKPTNLSWAIFYAKNSLCYDYHLSKNIINSDAMTSLPVHPAQVYEIIAMILIIIILFYLRRYLKRQGSLGYAYLILHSFFRFFIDFSKEGGTYIWGLKSMQWFMIVVIVIGLPFLLIREKTYKKSVPQTIPVESYKKSLILYLPILLFLIFPKDWLTPAEFRVLVISIILTGVVFIYRGMVYLLKRYRFFIRIPLTVASIAILETSLDTLKTQDTLKSIFYIETDAGYMKGQYMEICGGVVPYDAQGIGVNAYNKDKYNVIWGIKLRGYRAHRYDYDDEYGYTGSLIFDHEYISFDLGMGKVSGVGYPKFGIRLGPRNKAFIEGHLLNHIPADYPSPVIKLGFGFGTGGKDETTFHFGISEAGFYANPIFYLFDNRFKINLFLLSGSPESYQMNLNLGYRYYFKD